MQCAMVSNAVRGIEAEVDLAHLQLLEAGDLLDRDCSCISVNKARPDHWQGYCGDSGDTL